MSVNNDNENSQLKNESQVNNFERLYKRSKIVLILYWVLQIITIITMIFTIIRYFISASNTNSSLENTIMHSLLCILAIAVFNVPKFLEKRFKVYIPAYISILLFLLIFSHAVLGEIYRAYDDILLFDKILHTTSGITIALVSFSIVSILNNLQKNKFRLSPFFVVLFAFCFTMTAEYLWEIFENCMDRWFGSNMQRWQDSIIGEVANGLTSNTQGEYLHNIAGGNGLKDTMGDMIVNVFGALGVCIYGYIGMKIKPNWFTGKVILTKTDIEILKLERSISQNLNYSDSNNISNLEFGNMGTQLESRNNLVIPVDNNDSIHLCEKEIINNVDFISEVAITDNIDTDNLLYTKAKKSTNKNINSEKK